MSRKTKKPGKTLPQPLAGLEGAALLDTLNTHSMVSITDVEGAITYVNEKFCLISGYTREELIGNNHRLLKSEGYSKSFFRDMWRTITAGKIWHGVFRNRRKGGGYFWVQSTIAPIMGGNGKPRSYLAIRTDISGHYRAVTALEEFAGAGGGELFYFRLARALANALGVRWAGIGETRDGGTQVQMLGFCSDGNPAPLIAYPLAGTPCEHACTHDQPVAIESGVMEQYPDDAELKQMGAVSYRGEPLTAADGTSIGVLWAIDDRPRPEHPGERALLVTCAQRACEEIQRQQATSEVRQAHRTLQQLMRAQQAFSQVNHLIVHATDEKTLLQGVCEAIVSTAGYLMAWVGYRRDDPAKSIEPVAQAGFTKGYLDDIRFTWAKSGLGMGPGGTAIRTARTQVVNDLSHDLSKFGFNVDEAQRRGFRSLLALPLIEGNQSFGMLSVQSAELNNFHRDEIRMLEKLAGDLSFGILHVRSQQEKLRLQAQLRQAQKMESVGELTAGIAHDFNNILAIIMGNADLALSTMDPQDHPQRKYLEHVCTASERARDLIDKLMVFSRSDPVALDAEARCEPQRVVREALKMLHAALPSSLEIQTSMVSEGALWCRISADALQQLLTNIVINARDAMGGNGTLAIDLRRVSEAQNVCASCHRDFSGDFVRLCFHDTGDGIPADILQQVFEPFFSTKEVGRGTGLGLSMVHGIVHRRGGHITLSSQTGNGTTITAYLAPVDQRTDTQTAQGEPAESNYLALAGKRVLLVDDESALTTLYLDWLTEHDMQVIAFNDSQAALSHLHQHSQEIDMLVTDQTMPGLSGTGLARAAHELRPDLPVLICSGYGEDIKQLTESLGYITCLRKPFALGQLLAALQGMLRDA